MDLYPGVDLEISSQVAGLTASADFPTTPGAFNPSHNGWDAFVVKLNASGAALHYVTFLGGSNRDKGSAITVDGAGTASVTRYTSSPDFPITPGAFDSSFNVGYVDAFVVKLAVGSTAEPTGFTLSIPILLQNASGE